MALGTDLSPGIFQHGCIVADVGSKPVLIEDDLDYKIAKDAHPGNI
jgi:hypothetical protein